MASHLCNLQSLLTALLVFSRYSSVACLVRFGLVLVVREPGSNTRQMSENIVHTVSGASSDKSQEHRKTRAGNRKGRRKNAPDELMFCFSVLLMVLKERREVLHLEVKGISSFVLIGIQNWLLCWSLELPVSSCPLKFIHWL